jgi:hypothetical protein
LPDRIDLQQAPSPLLLSHDQPRDGQPADPHGLATLRPDVGKVRLQVNDRSSQLADVICELAKDSG